MTSPEHKGTKVRIKDGFVFMNEHDIIECVPDPEAEMTAENLLAGMEAIEKMADGKRMPILLMTSPRNSMTKEARDLDITARKEKYTLAQALVVSSMSTLMLGNFYIRVKRFPFPYKIFKSREKAIAWLRKKRLEAGKF